MDSWREHYQKLLKESRNEYLDKIYQMEKVNSRGVQTVSSDEVRKETLEMKNGRSAGPIGIPVELVTHGPSTL